MSGAVVFVQKGLYISGHPKCECNPSSGSAKTSGRSARSGAFGMRRDPRGAYTHI